MGFQRQIALGLGQFEHRKKNAEKFFVGGSIIFWARDAPAQALHRPNDDALGVGDDEGAEGTTENNDKFKRLPQNFHAAMDGIGAENGTDNNDKTDNEKQGIPGSLVFTTPKAEGTILCSSCTL